MRLTFVDELKSLLVGIVLTVGMAVAAVHVIGAMGDPWEDLGRDSTHTIEAGDTRWEPRVPSGN